MFISIAAEKAFDQFQQFFPGKSHAKNNSRDISWHNKGHIQELCSQHYTKCWKTTQNSKHFHLKWEPDKTVHSLFFSSTVFEVLAKATGKEKKAKGIQLGKELANVSLFTDNVILLYLRDLRDTTRKLLALTDTVQWGGAQS